MKKLWIVICLVCIAALLVSCSKREEKSTTGGQVAGEKQAHVAFVTNGVSDFWTIAEAGIRDAERKFNCKCDVLKPTSGTASEQKRILEDLVVRGVSGIAISPVNPKKVDMLDRAASKVNLICMDSDAKDSKRLCYVGTSNYDAGKAAGKELMKAIPNGGKVMVFVGTMDAQNAADRFRGIKDALKEANNTKIQIIDVMTDGMDHMKARANVEDTLVRYPDIAALVGLWSYNGPAIVSAVKAANKVGKVKIVCFDEDKATLTGVKDGSIFSTIVQKPYRIGYDSVRVLAALERGDKSVIPPNKIVNTGFEVINKNNVDRFTAEFKKLLGKK